MKEFKLILASMAVTCFTMFPAAAAANDELEVTMEIFEDIADVDGDVVEMRGPESDETSGDDIGDELRAEGDEGIPDEEQSDELAREIEELERRGEESGDTFVHNDDIDIRDTSDLVEEDDFEEGEDVDSEEVVEEESFDEMDEHDMEGDEMETDEAAASDEMSSDLNDEESSDEMADQSDDAVSDEMSDESDEMVEDGMAEDGLPSDGGDAPDRDA